MQEVFQEIKNAAFKILGRSISMLPGLLAALIVLLLTRIIAKSVRRVSFKIAQRTLRNRSLHKLVSQVSFVSTWVTGIMFAAVLAFPGLDLAHIVALLGFSSVAVGFAFQDIFKNFLAGVLLLIEEPFQLGDQIIVDEYEGTVEDIELRSTQIKTYKGEAVVLPNSLVFTSPIHVLTALPSRRTDLEIGVGYNTPLPMAIEALAKTTTMVEGVLAKPAVEVDTTSFGDSSINLTVRYWTLPEIRDVRQTHSRVMLALKQACDEAGIGIPYPIRSVYWYDQKQFSESEPQQRDTQFKNGSD
ncbi:MAG: mechanosensitive ion channel family protein [Cyanobacteria bacterium P01_F01_bin.153]